VDSIAQFFHPIPLALVAVVLVLALALGTLLCMPNQWAERFFRLVMSFFRSR
jgi:hypothetical protein